MHSIAHERGGLHPEVSFRPEEEGVYYVFLQAASAGLQLQKSPHLTLIAGAAK